MPTLRGRLTGIVDGRLVGWGFDPDRPDAPITLEIWIDETHVGDRVCDQVTEDPAARAGHPTGRCGFSHDIGNAAGASTVRVIEKETRRELPDSPLVPAFSPGPRERFFFVHIPKTAGTSLRFSLYEQFEPWEVFPTNWELRHLHGGLYPLVGALRRFPPGFFDRVRLLCGHYPLATGGLLPEAPRTLAFFREPMARAISNARVMRRRLGPQATDRDLVDVLYRHGRFNDQIHDAQVDYLSHDPIEGGHRRDLDRALENLERLDFVGLAEEYEEGVDLCNRLFGWRLASGTALNRWRDTARAALDESVLSLLEEATQKDRILYEAVRARYAILRDRHLDDG